MSAPYTSNLAESLAADVLARFERYVRIDTQSRRDRTASPSTPGQLELAELLAGELRAAGLEDAHVNEHGYVLATLDGSTSADGAQGVIGLIAHLDTSPDAPGRGVEPIVHRAYAGGRLELPREDISRLLRVTHAAAWRLLPQYPITPFLVCILLGLM
jgi:tripeptide aminopeptidase